jgi:ubiquinol-cytochrome c reductase cytochrome c1 subunit
MNTSKIASFAAALMLASGAALASGGPELRLSASPTDLHDVPSLQRGARDFVNYCLNCHSAKYMRYNRLTDIGLSEQQIAENLILTGKFVTPQGGPTIYVPTKVGDTMQTSLSPADGKTWFGAPPPDLSVEARVRGTAWLYNYLRAFYRDESSSTGWNNLVFPNVAMPHVLWELQGPTRLARAEFPNHEEAQAAFLAAKGIAALEPVPGGKYVVKTIVADAPGTLAPAEYDHFVADLVNYMDYMAEPHKAKRGRLGIVVLLFLGILFVAAYWLKREYWKDIH